MIDDSRAISCPTVIVKVPLRVSIVGGGSDLPGGSGAVVTGAINRYVWCVARARDDGMTYLTWREKEIVDGPKKLRHDLAREVLLYLEHWAGIELILFADVPGVGSGLGSSAATTIALLYAIMLLRGCSIGEISGEQLAEMASRIEIDRLRRKCGRQDHYACALGGIHRILFKNAAVEQIDRLDVQPWHWRELSEWFMLFRRRNLVGRNSDDVLAEFRDTPEFRQACQEISNECWNALTRCQWAKIPRLVRLHHEAKKLAFPSYWPADVDESKIDPHDHKLCGAGGTGHLLVCAPIGERATVLSRAAMAWGPPVPFRFVREGATCCFSEGIS